jgi:drug/metabolite transporter (DMT)-like permease
MPQRAAAGIIMALAATLFYGQVPVLARFAYLDGIPAIETILTRTLVVALVFAGIAKARRIPLRLAQGAMPAFGLQVLATIMVSVCYLISLQFIPVSLAVIIFFTFPVIVLLAAPLAEGHAPSAARIGVAALAFAGLAIAIGPDFSSLDLTGMVLASISAFGCALQFFSGRQLARYMHPVAVSSLVHAAALPAVLALAWWLSGGEFKVLNSTTASAAGVAALIGVSVAYVGGYFLHMSSLTAAPASTVVPFFNFEPVMSTVMAGLVLGERLAANQYLGGGIVLVALAVCGIIERRRKP